MSSFFSVVFWRNLGYQWGMRWGVFVKYDGKRRVRRKEKGWKYRIHKGKKGARRGKNHKKTEAFFRIPNKKLGYNYAGKGKYMLKKAVVYGKNRMFFIAKSLIFPCPYAMIIDDRIRKGFRKNESLRN